MFGLGMMGGGGGGLSTSSSASAKSSASIGDTSLSNRFGDVNVGSGLNSTTLAIIGAILLLGLLIWKRKP